MKYAAAGALLLCWIQDEGMGSLDDLWKQARDKARRREYAGAEELLKGTPAQPEAKKRLEEDLRAVALAREVFEAAIEELGARTGQEVSVKSVELGGRSRPARGKVVRANRTRLQLQGSGKGFVFVEIDEIDAESLSRIFETKGGRRKMEKEEAVKVAYFLLLEGEPDLAKRALGKEASAIPERYWTSAAEIRAAVDAGRKNAPDRQLLKRDSEARDLFYLGLTEAESPETTLAAIDRFKDALNKYGDTPFVQKHKAEIERRAGDTGKETLVRATDISKSTGVWELKELPGAPIPKVWTAKKDTVDQNYSKNALEFSFFALHGVKYEIWVHAFVCCQETAKFFFQGTEVSITKDGQTTSAGLTDRSSAANAPPTELPGTCGGHDPSKHKWMWLRVKWDQTYTGPGVKGFRLMTEVGDVAVSHVLIASTGRRPASTPEWFRDN
jgi:hypothetical protein